MSNDKLNEHEEYLKKFIYYYVDVEEGFWQPREGECISIDYMEASYLENCIRRIKSDVNKFNRKPFNNDEVEERLVERACKKLEELQEELRFRV